MIQSAVRRPPKSADAAYARVAKLMKAALPPGSMKDFDFKELDLALDDSRTARLRCDTNLDYFVGIFLKNRGDTERIPPLPGSLCADGPIQMEESRVGVRLTA